MKCKNIHVSCLFITEVGSPYIIVYCVVSKPNSNYATQILQNQHNTINQAN